MSGKLALSLSGHILIVVTIINICCIFQTKSDIHVGPWGGHGGNMWSYEPKGDITHITVTYDDVVHSICFTSIDQNGNLYKSKFPCKEAAKTADINIDVKTEKINGISGTFDTVDKCSKTITSLSFTSNNNKTYGPFGTVKGTAFSLVVDDEGFSGFHGSTGWLLDSIGVSIVIPSTPTSEDVGPFGGPGGLNQYDIMVKGELSHITIHHGGAIRTMTITSEDENGVLYTSRMIGGTLPITGGDYPNDNKEAQIALDIKNGERIVQIIGTAGYYLNYFVVTSLVFYTNKGRTFGPFGGGPGASSVLVFTYKADNNYLSGFYGRDGDFIDSMGFHVKAEPKKLCEWGNVTAGKAWTYQPNNGSISHISITYKDAIYSISFTSMDGNGTMVKSKKFGKNTGSEKAEVDIDPTNENLIGISGTTGAKKGWEVITSLTFFTDNNRTFGPFGSETGTAFSVPLKDGFISGFHGRSGEWVNAIGVYVKPI